MKIKANTVVDVELSEEDKFKITKQTLCELFKWPQPLTCAELPYIKDGKLKQNQIVSSSHTFNMNVTLRDATKTDLALELILTEMEMLRLKMKSLGTPL